ncbi:DUF418 domain-containing protein [Alphaproteobacteria bacterium]|nr:DUF418 domain-containing protein [Alphaproteobacteria bacterium]
MERSTRLDGLDVARLLAFIGMVIVNFKIVMGVPYDASGWLVILTSLLEGRAAATFVVLAGLGLGLAAVRGDYSQTVSVTLKRAAFLLVLGLLNSLIFEADILHYYAFYFLFGVFCLGLSNRLMVASVIALNIAFVVMILTLNYDAEWNWTDFSYQGFWTLSGFVKNLFFNGWHPVIPWLSFFLVGICLSRLDLRIHRTRNRLMMFGLIGSIVASLTSAVLIHLLAGDPETAILFTTEPIPPMPLYVIAGLSEAVVTMMLCLYLGDWLQKKNLLGYLVPAGRQTLTLYIAHIIIGMVLLEAFGLVGDQSIGAALLAALLFSLASIVYAFVWAQFFKRGPLESLMRLVAG